jgi:hypothetical protein
MSKTTLTIPTLLTFLLGGIALAFVSFAARAAEETGKPYKVDDEGFIRNWVVLGPIKVDDKVGSHDEANCKEFLDKEYYPGQKTAMPKDGDKVKVDGSEAAWKAVESGEYSVDLGKVATDAGKEAEHAAYLGTVYVISDKEMPDVKLAIGSDDDSVWRLDGKEVIRAYAGRAIDKDQDKSEPVTLKQGVNVLTFVVLNGDGPTAAAARFLDKEGNPIKGLTISVAPPATK